MKIRKYQEADREGLVTLWQTVFPNNPPHNAPAQMIDQKLAQDDLIFVAEAQGRIAGACMAGYDGHRGWLYAVAVFPDLRRRGLGRSMIRTVMDVLSQMGCTKVNLQIRADNTGVAAFYQSLGFRVEDRLSMGCHIQGPENP